MITPRMPRMMSGHCAGDGIWNPARYDDADGDTVEPCPIFTSFCGKNDANPGNGFVVFGLATVPLGAARVRSASAWITFTAPLAAVSSNWFRLPHTSLSCESMRVSLE